jgi:hypothetical protein
MDRDKAIEEYGSPAEDKDKMLTPRRRYGSLASQHLMINDNSLTKETPRNTGDTGAGGSDPFAWTLLAISTILIVVRLLISVALPETRSVHMSGAAFLVRRDLTLLGFWLAAFPILVLDVLVLWMRRASLQSTLRKIAGLR